MIEDEPHEKVLFLLKHHAVPHKPIPTSTGTRLEFSLADRTNFRLLAGFLNNQTGARTEFIEDAMKEWLLTHLEPKAFSIQKRPQKGKATKLAVTLKH